MQVPLEVTYVNVQKTDRIHNLIEAQAAGLEDVSSNIISCSVAVEKPHEHQNNGNPFRVRVLVRIPPNHEIVSRRESSKGDMHESLSTVIVDAFEAARRQCRKLEEKRAPAETKRRSPELPTGIVVRLFPEDGYGFIKTDDGQDIYFHQNSVLHNDFERLSIGTLVRYVEQMGDEGPQASSVDIIDKPGKRLEQVDEVHLEPPLGWESNLPRKD